MSVLVIGLGPAGLGRLPESTRTLLLDPTYTVVLRTIAHPAAMELSELREVVTCDDLYGKAETFEDVYESIVGRVLDLAQDGPLIYAVPG
ncbi:MAG TPA: nucleotide pyrophosphohydrolase, partial [Acidimicrobiia bacterium]